MVMNFKRSFCLKQGCKTFDLKQGQISLNSLITAPWARVTQCSPLACGDGENPLLILQRKTLYCQLALRDMYGLGKIKKCNEMRL